MKALFALLIFLLPWLAGHSQESLVRNSVGMGFHLNQYQQDFGMGLQLTSPYFLQKRLAVRNRFNVMFHDHRIPGGSKWTPYVSNSIGFVNTAAVVKDFLRLYGEGGFLFLFPADDFSAKDVQFGGYGLFGFEFNFGGGAAYFIELGGIGTGARAELTAEREFYSNGFMIGTGFRRQF